MAKAWIYNADVDIWEPLTGTGGGGSGVDEVEVGFGPPSSDIGNANYSAASSLYIDIGPAPTRAANHTPGAPVDRTLSDG